MQFGIKFKAHDTIWVDAIDEFQASKFIEDAEKQCKASWIFDKIVMSDEEDDDESDEFIECIYWSETFCQFGNIGSKSCYGDYECMNNCPNYNCGD